MRHFLSILLLGALALAGPRLAWAQSPADGATTGNNAPPEIGWRPLPPPPVTDSASLVRDLDGLRSQQVALQKAPADEDLQKKVELLQKQIETLEKQVKLLADELKKQPASTAVDKLQVETARLEARSIQAAHRDQELAASIDDLREHVDSEERYGPQLPATLKELFDPSENNETPLSIYGALAFGYSKIFGNPTTAAGGAGRPSTPGGFYFGEFTPDFLLKLNDWILLEAEIAVGADGTVNVGSFAQIDFFVNDWLTITAGRFVAPIGWYNERINNPWINKLPADAPGSGPLLWQQVLPPLSLLGVQAQGAFYLGCSPLKFEYSAYVSNGLNLTPATAGAPTIDELANLENMENTLNITTNNKAFGGRVGLWWPEMGLEAGVSGMYNSVYIDGFPDNISLGAVDLNYHKGNWDVRLEYGLTYQQTGSFAGTPGLQQNNIRRQGFYGQIAYRPYDSCNRFLQNTEVVYRYTWVDFNGIDPTALDLTTYSTPMDVPVRRQQNEFGVNYYFAPRMVLKCAYQINDEAGFHLHDNQFLTELAWGW